MIAIETRAYPGERDCGDQLEYWRDDNRLTCCIVDGLGHGSKAKEAACKIIQFVAQNRSMPLDHLFTQCDRAMVHERGGVMAIAWIEGNNLTYGSVGNISGYLVRVNAEKGTHDVVQLHMDRGLISGGFSRLNIQELTLSKNDLLILHSDGLNSVFNLDPWQGTFDNPDKLTKSFMEDQRKTTDDASILIYRHEGDPQ